MSSNYNILLSTSKKKIIMGTKINIKLFIRNLDNIFSFIHHAFGKVNMHFFFHISVFSLSRSSLQYEWLCTLVLTSSNLQFQWSHLW